MDKTVEVVKTFSQRTQVNAVFRGVFQLEAWLRVRKERECWRCHGKLEDCESGYVSLAFTDRGNKFLCDSCVDYFAEQGVPLTDRTPSPSPEVKG